MSKQIINWIPAILLVLIVIISNLLGQYNLCYHEQWNTFFYQHNFIIDRIAKLNGINELFSLFIIQFFVNPLQSTIVNTLFLMSIYMLMRGFIKNISDGNILIANTLPIILISTVMAMQYNTNLEFSFGTSILILALCLYIWSLKNSSKYRLISALVITPTILYIAGGVSILFVIICISNAIIKKEWTLFIALAELIIFAIILIFNGLAMNFQQIFTLELYTIIGLKVSALPYECWLVIIILSLTSILAARFPKITEYQIVYLSLALLSLGLGFIQRNKSNEIFKQLNYLSRQKNYDQMLELCQKIDQSNILYHNYRNMAMAEKGILANEIFSYPNINILSIYLQGEKSPFIYAALSDIFYSMGHISMSQQHAFEACEMMRNLSPKMLMRLAETNIAQQQLDVAKKYLSILCNTLYYSDIAKTLISKIQDGTIYEIEEYKTKRTCIPNCNAQVGFVGLDIVLRQILENKTSNKTTIEYLGCLYLLDKNIRQFVEIVSQFYGTECLPELPKYFQVGIYKAYRDNPDTLSKYKINPDKIAHEINNYENFYRKIQQ